MAYRWLVLPALLAALAACSPAEHASRAPNGVAHAGPGVQRHPWTRPNTLRVAISVSPNTLDPILSTQQFETQLEALVFDPLVATDPEGRDVPILAARVPSVENGDIAADGRTITYRLRHGVTWHDGVAFTSHDVAFTWHAIMNPATAVSSRHGYDRIARIDTPDASTAVFHLKTRFAPAVHTFFAHSDSVFTPLPAHVLERYHDLNRIPFNALPIGTGPYRLVRWVRGDRLEYAANDRYFLGKPHIAKIVVHIVPDENTIVNQMRAHEIDWFMMATPHVYPQLRAIDGIAVRLVPFNGADSIIFNTARAPFSDVRLRRAVGMAIDKVRLVHDVTYGTAVAATEDLPNFLWAFDRSAGTSSRDLAAARRTLDAAGWLAGGDSIRVRDGKRLTLGLAYRTDSLTDRNRGVVIAAMLREAGIEVELKGYTTALLYGPFADGGILASGKYEAGLQTWYAGVDPDDSTQLLCSERPPHGFNWSRYCSRELDAAETAALANYDRPARTRAYAIVQRVLARDAPFVYLWWPRQIEAVNDDLRGFRPNGIVEDWNAYAWRFAGT
ncbi:MAG: peptide-binding protein [Vulcanimicrobiaceae bacterium]